MPDLGNGSVFSQTDASNNGATMPGWSGSALPSTIDDAGRALQGAVFREWNWRNPTVTSGGTANAQTLTYSVAPAALYNGQQYTFVAGATNTGATTLNVNALGATTVKKLVAGTGVALVGGEIVSGNIVTVRYNSAGTCFYIDYVDKIWTQGTAVASAGTVTFGEYGYVQITGTTTITALAFSSDRAGKVIVVNFAGALTLTHNATSLILPGGASITTAAGDRAAFVSEGSGNFRCLWYTYASAVALTATTGTTPYYAARAWVNFNGNGVIAIRASANVTSLTDNGVGDYTINITTALPDTNYAAVFGTASNSTTTVQYSAAIRGSTSAVTTKTTTALRIVVGATSLDDTVEISAAIFR